MGQAFSPSRAMYSPTSTQSHSFVGVLVFMETHRRVLGGLFGRIPSHLKDDAFGMGGYCLDAHPVLPAGSVEYLKFGPGDDEWHWSPTTVDREGEEP